MFTGIPRIDDKIIPVPETGCWLWTGCINSQGYGTIRWCRRMDYIHRVVYRLTHRKPIPHDMVMLHSCDTRACCNPYHVRPASHRANMRDMVDKGRAATIDNGRHWAAKLGYRIRHGYWMEPAGEEA